MKRICFFSGDITRGGGTERVAIRLANEMVRSGKYQIRFLSLTEQRNEPFFEIDPGIQRDFLSSHWVNPGPGYLPVIWKVRKYLKEKRIDVVIDIDIVLDVLSLPARKGLKTKVISWEHFNYEFEQTVAYRKWILRYSFTRSDYVVTLTEQDRRNYERNLERRKRIIAIPNPVPDAEELKEGATARENWILTVGALLPDKGMDDLSKIAFWVLKRRPDWKWLLLGEGPERGKLERFIVKKGLQDRLILTGAVQNVGDYYRKAKIMVLTSRHEGLPMCLLEAKSYGLAGVSFDIETGPSEIIEDGVNGYIVPARDCRAMAKRLLELTGNGEKLEHFSAHAKDGIGKFEMSRICRQWDEVIKQVCE